MQNYTYCAYYLQCGYIYLIILVPCSLVATPHRHSHLVCVFCHSFSPLCLSVQRGECALRIAVRKGHLDVVKVLVQVYRDSHMEREVDQYYLDLADDHHHQHVVEYLSSEFPSLQRKVRHPALD